MERSEIILHLESCDFFEGLQREYLREIANLCHLESYAAGDKIFRQGDLGDRIFIVVEGHVFLERSMDVGTRKGSAVIGVLSKGRGFGCWSTLLDEKHTLMSSAVCRKPTRVLVIRGSDLRQMMLEKIELGFNVLERLCFLLQDRLKGAYDAMENI
ncbi:MAG: cyclic nucleotide-binding domain-containing protein [Deltaproteobacteria bacterium]|nr:MAG: cyclic nucleotide-binding domain-containing protein [Deltaproteobacteria bacterium]